MTHTLKIATLTVTENDDGSFIFVINEGIDNVEWGTCKKTAGKFHFTIHSEFFDGTA